MYQAANGAFDGLRSCSTWVCGREDVQHQRAEIRHHASRLLRHKRLLLCLLLLLLLRFLAALLLKLVRRWSGLQLLPLL